MARKAFAHDAVVVMRDGASPDALGGAVTKELCGGWDHRPPCPLAPHYVRHAADGETIMLRVVFASRLADEERVRGLIEKALEAGCLTVPDGSVACWVLKSASTGRLHTDEADLAAHLIAH